MKKFFNKYPEIKFFFFGWFADFCASISYKLAKDYYSPVFASTTEMFAYCNGYIVVFLVILSPLIWKYFKFNIYDCKSYFKDRVLIFATTCLVITGIYKTILLSNLPVFSEVNQLVIRGYSLLCPFLTILLWKRFSKEKAEKLGLKFYLTFALGLFGLSIFNWDGMAFNFSIWVFSYVLFNSYAEYKTRIARNQYEDDSAEPKSNSGFGQMTFFDNIMYTVIMSPVFIFAQFFEPQTKLIGITKFDITKLFNKQAMFGLFVVALVSFFAHCFKMFAIKAKDFPKLVLFLILAKSFNSIFMYLWEYKTLPSIYQISGFFILLLTFMLYEVMNKKKIVLFENKK
jgi:hypothetical protein